MKLSLISLVPALILFQLQVAHAQRGAANTYNHAPRSVRSRDVDQEHLKLDLKIDLEKEEYTGHAEWTLSPFKPVRSVTLDNGDEKIKKVAIGDGEKPEKFRDLKSQTRTDSLEITLDREYAAGEKFVLAVDYEVKEPRKGGHFVVPDETEPNRARGFWTQGEQDDARFLLPCFDSPTDRFTSEINVTVPKQYQVISNGEMRNNKENDDGTRTFHWVQAQTLVTYLLSVCVGEYDALEQKWDGLPVISYVP